MKKLLLFFLLISINVFSQTNDFEIIRKINGVEIYARKSMTKEGKKKDTWIIEFEIVNKTDSDIFYKSRFGSPDMFSQILGENDKKELNYFASVALENTRGISFISDSEINLSGDRTRLKTDRGESIFVLKKGKIYTKTMDFRADKGTEPVIVVMSANGVSFTGSLYDFM